ncbi:MAG: heme exporter protein CcmB [Candidatus Hodarchaeales archaeon]|jgi:heme exporter protein B
MSLINDVYYMVKKDLVLEFRTKETLFSMGLFSFAAVLIFSSLFQLIENITLEAQYTISTAAMWFIITFTIMLGVNSVFSRETQKNSIYSLLSLPVKPQAIFLAKLLYLIIVVGVVEIFAFIVAIVFLNISTQGSLIIFGVVLIFGTVDLAVAGCVVSLLTIYAKSKTLAIPILFFPLILPSIIIAADATRNLTFYYDPMAAISNALILFFHAVIISVLTLLLVEDLISE